MNQGPQPFLILKQLILLQIFKGSNCAGTRGEHIVLEYRGQFTPVLGGQFAWIFRYSFKNPRKTGILLLKLAVIFKI